VTVGSGSSSPLSIGAKRATAPSGSTPPAKQRFLGSWKPWYAMQIFICYFLYCICDFDLVFLVYSVPSSGRYPLWGPSIVGAPQTVGPHDTVEAHSSKGPSDGAVGGDRVPVFGAAVEVGAAAQVTADGRSPAPEVFPEGDTNDMAEEVAASDLAASIGSAGVRSPPPQRLTLTSPWRSLGSS
jgi:hypothetical protein